MVSSCLTTQTMRLGALLAPRMHYAAAGAESLPGTHAAGPGIAGARCTEAPSTHVPRKADPAQASRVLQRPASHKASNSILHSFSPRPDSILGRSAGTLESEHWQLLL